MLFHQKHTARSEACVCLLSHVMEVALLHDVPAMATASKVPASSIPGLPVPEDLVQVSCLILLLLRPSLGYIFLRLLLSSLSFLISTST